MRLVLCGGAQGQQQYEQALRALIEGFIAVEKVVRERLRGGMGHACVEKLRSWVETVFPSGLVFGSIFSTLSSVS